MDVHSHDTRSPADEKNARRACHASFPLADIRRGKEDKLGNKVQEILWCGAEYIVYRSCLGVYVHFADCADTEARQRKAFNEICPELCELRFLTHEMHRKRKVRNFLRWIFRWSRKEDGRPGASLFEHNIAQAIMLLMEDDPKPAKAIAKAALAMAVVRSTNDNTIRYVRSSIVASLWAIPLAYFAIYPPAFLPDSEFASTCFIAALFGVLGAAFSVITRVQSFRMKPCQQSNMNYMMARTRIAIGLIAGLMLYLLLAQPFGHAVINQTLLDDWKAIAVIGFVAGFAERLVPTVFQRTAAGLEESSGTPVQAARSSHGHSPALP